MGFIKLQNQSFRTRVVVMASALLLILSLLIAMATAWISNLQLQNILFTQGQEWSSSLAKSSVAALLYQDNEIIKDSVSTIMESGKVSYIELVNKHGETIMQQGQKHARAERYPQPHTKNMAFSETSDYWLYSVNVISQAAAPAADSINELGFIDSALQRESTQQLLGQIHLTMSKQSLKDASTQIFTYNLLIALSVSCVLIIFLSVMSHRLFAPLETLVRLMGQTSHGQWQSYKKLKGAKEIVEISHAYNDMIETLRQRDDELVNNNLNLEQTIKQRTEQLQESNEQLKAFNYSVSHDLRSPLRSINGFSKILIEDYIDKLDEDGQEYLNRVCSASERMGNLIDDMLKLSRISQCDMSSDTIPLDDLAKKIIDVLIASDKDRKTEIIIHPGLTVTGDLGLIRIMMENLIGNAWKYSSTSPLTFIEIGKEDDVFFIRDKGTGFDMQYANKLFTPFNRLHTADMFEGTGIGLATVKRIIDRHNGKVWADSDLDEGSTFYFKL